MFIYKKLKASDANTIAFEAHKEYNIDKDNTSSLGVSLLDSSYSSASRDTYSLFDVNNHKQYFQLDHLFYKDALFNYGNLIGGIDYNNQEKRLYDKATIISLSQKTFGSGVQKGTFLFNNTYKDDSLGNLYQKNDILSNYPQDKERVFYLAPVKGFKSVDLTRDPNTGEPIVNAATSYNSLKLDDSLYINPVEYISCSFAKNTTLNCTEVDLTNGYIKAPNSNNYNFGNEDFTISFYYKVNVATSKSYILAKSKTQTVVEYPESNLDGSLKNTHGSASLLQPKEVDAGKAFPFEIFVDARKLYFNRADQDTESTHNSSLASISGNTLYHVACVKTGSELKIYLDGALSNGTGTDTTDLCQNKADLFIGTDPTISSSKLDNTSDQSISQLMIWNRGLTATEVANVSESIDGSPYVGNIFYENGIATLTSPKVNSGTLTSLQDFTDNITLDNTPYDQGDGTTTILRQPTFSGSLTFTSSRETLETGNMGIHFDDLVFNSTYLSASLGGSKTTTLSLVSKPYALLDDYIIYPIQTETFDTYNNYTLLDPIVDAIPGGIGTGSGDRGTDGDSITTTENILDAFEGVFLAENQTVTESINVLFISNSQELVTENFPDTDNQITDTVFAFGNTDFTGAGGGSFELTNDGGEYISANSINRSILLVSGNNDNGGYFQGQLRRYGGGGTETIYDENANTVPFTAAQNLDGSSPRVVPAGLSAGNTFETSTDSIDFTESANIKVQVSGSITNISGYPGNGAGSTIRLKVRKERSDGTFATVWDITDGGFSNGVDTSVSIQTILDTIGIDEKDIDVDSGDKLFMTCQVNVPNGWFNTGNFSYDLSTIRLRVVGVASTLPSEGFKNKITLQHTLGNIKPQSIYKYRLNGIRTRLNPTLNTYPFELWGANNTNLGLSKDIDNNDVGVRVTVFQGNQRITSSLFPSSSGATSLDFSFDRSTGTNTDDLRLFIYPGISSTFTPVFSGKTQGFALEDNFTVTELSGSNVVTLNENLSNHFTASENVSSQIIFTDTSNFINSYYSTTNPANILGFVGNDPKKVLVDNTYFTTSSLTSTASLERGNFISGSASIDITGTKGLYKVENVTLGTSDYPGTQTQTAIGSDQKVRIQTKKNGVLQDTKYISGDLNAQNAFPTENDKLNLGVLDNTDNVSFEFTVVDSDNNVDKVIKNQGFNVQRIELSKITSSNEVTQVNSDPFPSNLDALYFSSSHINVGDASMPFTIGQVTASIASISADGTTITLDDDLFITSSLSGDLFHVSGAENGPFIISASLPVTTQLVGNNKEYQVIETFHADPNSQDPGANEGLASHLSAGDNIISNIFIDPPNTVVNSTTTYRNFSPYDTLNQQYNFFVSGVASPLYPNGIITSSAGIDYTCSFDFGFNFSAISGSNISSGDTFTNAEFAPFTSYQSNILKLTSSHNDDPHFPNLPLYTQGKQDINILGRTSDGHIKVIETLFITASSEATGSSNSSSITPGDFSFTPENPIAATGVTSDMLGGTFEFQDLGTLETNTYQITLIDDSDPNNILITLDNQGIGDDAIQTVNESNLTNTPEVTVEYSQMVANDFTIQYKNSHLIFENEFHCTVDEDEYNFSLNPTARKNKDINKGDLANFATGSNFKPYVTTVGLYNEAGELLVVGKLGQPIRMSDETDTTFVVRYDT